MIDPKTGLWVDQVLHTPGPGGNPLVGGLMDVYNTFQSRNLRDKQSADEMIQRLALADKDPEFYQNLENSEQGAGALGTLGIQPDTMDNTIQGSPTYRYHRGLEDLGPDDLTPKNLLYTASQTKPEEMVKMYPLVRAQEIEEGKTLRERETQKAKDMRDYSDKYVKWFKALYDKGVPADKADKVAEGRAGLTTLTPEERATVKKRAMEEAQLEGSMAPDVKAKIAKLESSTELDQAKAADIKNLSNAKKAALWATVHSKEAGAAYIGVKKVLAQTTINDVGMKNGMRDVALAAKVLNESVKSMSDPLVQMDDERMETLKQLVEDMKPALNQALQKLQTSYTGPMKFRFSPSRGTLEMSRDNGATWTLMNPNNSK